MSCNFVILLCFTCHNLYFQGNNEKWSMISWMWVSIFFIFFVVIFYYQFRTIKSYLIQQLLLQTFVLYLDTIALQGAFLPPRQTTRLQSMAFSTRSRVCKSPFLLFYPIVLLLISGVGVPHFVVWPDNRRTKSHFMPGWKTCSHLQWCLHLSYCLTYCDVN